MSTGRSRRKPVIRYSEPSKILELIMELIEDSSSAVQMKINQFLMQECESATVFVIVVFSERMEASIDAIGMKELPRKAKMSMTDRLIECYKCHEVSTDSIKSFGAEFQRIVTPYLSEDSGNKTILTKSIRDKPFSVIVCMETPKISEDIAGAMIREVYTFVWPALKKAIALEHECSLKRKCQQLLRVAKKLFTQVSSLDSLLQIAMEQAKFLTKAEHCLVKMVDMDHMMLTEQIYLTQASNTEVGQPVAKKKSHHPMNLGIVGQVLKTGALINCKNARNHPQFSASIDSRPGVECKALLCFPIRDQTGIIGVGQLVNKLVDPYFDSIDEEMALAFSIYCGVCIMHSVYFRKIQEAHIRNTLANELVMYHMKVSEHEVSGVIDCTWFHEHPQLKSLHFNHREIPQNEYPCFALKFFIDLGLLKRFKLKLKKLVRFILYTQKGYRSVPYHNFSHAFAVAQWAYASLTTFKLVSEGYLTEMQALMYVVAALVHDLDHRGTTNSFQIHGQTSLAALYSSEGSVMERHHLAQAMCILNTEGCDILDGLSRRDYDRAIIMLRDIILASDLTNYFKRKHEFTVIANDFQKNNKEHNEALLAILMNCADLSDQLKSWGSVKITAASVLTEFFHQGDVEKKRGELPMPFMDRDRCVIPELEIQFLSETCIPMYTILSKIILKAIPFPKILENHIERWDASKPVFQEVPTTAGLSVLLSPELDSLIELYLKEKAERLEREAAAAKAAAEAAAAAAQAEAEEAEAQAKLREAKKLAQQQ